MYKKTTPIGNNRSDGCYLIDEDGDGTWDYIYDPIRGSLTPYAQDIEEKQQRKELLWMPTLIIMIIIVTAIALIIAAFYKENK